MSQTGTALTLENVLYEKKDAIAYVTLNRPKVLNALSQRTWEDLRAAFEDARDDAADDAGSNPQGRAGILWPGPLRRQVRLPMADGDLPDLEARR